MFKKVELHTDAVIVIIAIFLVSFGVNLYQRHQYSTLLAEHLDTRLLVRNTETNLETTQRMLDQCLRLPTREGGGSEPREAEE